MNKYQKIKVLGKGSFGEALLVSNLDTKVLCSFQIEKLCSQSNINEHNI